MTNPPSTTVPPTLATTERVPSPSALIRSGNFFFRYRNAVFPLVSIPLLLVFRPVLLTGDAATDRILDAVGIAITLGGSILRMAVIGFKYVKRGGKGKKVYADTLVVEGFFNHCRNPLYVGNVMIVLGLLVIHANPWTVGLGVAFFGYAYIAIVAAEENYLQQKFGADYDTYRRRVSRWWINPLGLRQSLHGMRFAWGRVIIKEYGSTALALWCIVALLGYERWANTPEYVWNETAKLTLGIAAGVVALLYVAARLLKKTGTLRDTPDA